MIHDHTFRDGECRWATHPIGDAMLPEPAAPSAAPSGSVARGSPGAPDRTGEDYEIEMQPSDFDVKAEHSPSSEAEDERGHHNPLHPDDPECSSLASKTPSVTMKSPHNLVATNSHIMSVANQRELQVLPRVVARHTVKLPLEQPTTGTLQTGVGSIWVRLSRCCAPAPNYNNEESCNDYTFATITNQLRV